LEQRGKKKRCTVVKRRELPYAKLEETFAKPGNEEFVRNTVITQGFSKP